MLLSLVLSLAACNKQAAEEGAKNDVRYATLPCDGSFALTGEKSVWIAGRHINVRGIHRDGSGVTNGACVDKNGNPVTIDCVMDASKTTEWVAVSGAKPSCNLLDVEARCDDLGNAPTGSNPGGCPTAVPTISIEPIVPSANADNTLI